MVIEIPKTPVFIQFSKYIMKNGCIGLQFDFPLAPWSEEYYEQLKQELQRSGFCYTTGQTRADEEVLVREFLTVDIKKDVSKAATLARTILRSVFGLHEYSQVTLYFSNVSPKEETITS